MPDWSSIARHLNEAGVLVSDDATPLPIGGGDISAAWRLQGKDREIFLKTGRAASLPMFTGEADGLSE